MAAAAGAKMLGGNKQQGQRQKQQMRQTARGKAAIGKRSYYGIVKASGVF